MYCSDCGAQNADTNRFCLSCGHRLAMTDLPAAGVTLPAALAVAQPTPRRRRRWPIFVGGGILAVLVLAVAAYLFARQWLRIGTNEAANLMPANTGIMLSISPSPLQLSRLQDLGLLAGAVGGLAGGGSIVPSELLNGQADVDFARDIQPWVGLEMAAGLLYDKNSAPALVISVATRNSAASQTLMQKMRRQFEASGEQFRDETYHDVAISYQVSSGTSDQIAYAELNRFVVVATSHDALLSTIDAAQGRLPGISANTAYQAVMGQLGASRIGYLYLDQVILQELLDNESFPLPGGTATQEIGAAIALENNGLRLDFVQNYDSRKLPAALRQAMTLPANRNRILPVLPADVLMLFSGQNIALFSQQIADLAGTIGDNQDALGEALSTMIRVDLTRDVYTWADGEYAMALVYDPTATSDPLGLNMPASLLLAFETKDRAAAERALLNMADGLERETGVRFVDEAFGDTNFRFLSDSYGYANIGYAFVGDFVVLSNSKSALRSIGSAGGATLSRNDRFSQVAATLPSNNSGYTFLDVERIIQLVYDAMSSSEKTQFDRDTRPQLEAIRALGVASQQTNDADTILSSLFILLTPQ